MNSALSIFKKKQSGVFQQHGVSLIEMLLVVAIIVILSAITIPIESGVLTRQSLSDGTSNIQMALRSANLQARLGSNGLGAGVWFGDPVDGKPNVVSYRGPSYAERNVDLDMPVEVPGGLVITVTPNKDISFQILSSTVPYDTIIRIENSTGARILQVNTTGTVLENKIDDKNKIEANVLK